MSENKRESLFQEQEGGVAVSEEPRGENAPESAAPLLETTEREPADEDLELQVLLKTAEDIINTPPPRDSAEIDEKAGCYEQLEKRLEVLPDIKKSRLVRLERIEKEWREGMAARRKNAVEIAGDEYDKFAESKPGKTLLENLQKVEKTIATMEASERDDAMFTQMREALHTKRDKIMQSIADIIYTPTEEAFTERIAHVRERANNLYASRAEELTAEVKKLKEDPEVMARHVERLTEAEAKEEAERKEAEEMSAREQIAAEIALLPETFIIAASLINRQKDALARIGEIAGESGNPENIRTKLIDAVLLGEGERQVKNPDEIAPWKKFFRAAPYIDSLNNARHDKPLLVRLLAVNEKYGITKEVSEKAHRTITLLEQVDENDKKLRDILGPEWQTVRFRDKKTGEMRETRRQTPLFAAFETRKKNDQKGETDRLRKQRAEDEKRIEAERLKMAERAKALEAAVQKLKDKETDYAAVVTTPVGAVLLEAKKSKKGNTYIGVVDAVGDAAARVKKGSAFPYYSNMPEWLRTAITRDPTERAKIDNALDALRRER